MKVSPAPKSLSPRLPWWLGRGLLAAGLALAGPGQAQPPTPATDYIARSWQVDDGLPHSLVNRVVQDDRGFLWLATAAGLTRFDGRNFKLYPLPAQPTGMSFNIRDLVREPGEGLLLLPASGGVMRFHDGVFEEHPASSALVGKSLVDLFAEPDGTLWIGTEDETLIRWQAGKLVTFTASDGINRRGNRFSFARDRTGRIWIAGGDFLGWYEDGRLQPFPRSVGTSIVVAPARTGGLWISSYERMLKWENGRLITVRDKPEWPVARSSVYQLFEDSSGTLWIATRRHGLFLLAGDKLTHAATANPLIMSVSEDRESNIWVSMDGGGLNRLRSKAFVLINHEAGLVEDVSASVCSDEQGAIWAANRSGGLVRYHEGKAEIIVASPPGSSFFANTVVPDHTGHIWCGTTTGLYRVTTAAPHGLEQMSAELGTVRVLFTAHTGEIWVGSGDGELGYFQDGRYQALRPDQGHSDERITAIAESPAGDIWAATRDGALFQWHDGTLIPKTALYPERTLRINSLHFDRAGALWIATPQGLILKREDRLHIFTVADGLPDDNLDQLLEDDAGHLWFGSRRGLFHIPMAELKARADNPDQPVVRSMTLGKDEGLAGTTSILGTQPLTWKSADGRLWFSTPRGIVGLQPAAFARVRAPPSVYIDEVRIDGQRAASQGIVQIPSGRHRVDFQFVALNFSAPEKVQVRHQLSGMDLDWVQTSSEHAATYPRLPPGRYEMRVRAGNQDGLWNETGAKLTVIMAAAWWQTWWFAGAALLAFTGLVAWLARHWSHRRLQLRLKRLEHAHALEKERARIARDLHDELGGGITQVKLLAERLKRPGSSGEIQATAGKLAWRAKRLTADLQSIVWAVSPHNNTWDRLAAFIGQFAQRFFRETGVQCLVEGSEGIPARALAPETQHHLLAVTKEALNNTLKHAQATQVIITLSQTDNIFGLLIHDNGVGFVPANPGHTASNGLNNMYSRIGEIGGTLTIRSEPRQGTTIIIRLPLDHNPVTPALNPTPSSTPWPST